MLASYAPVARRAGALTAIAAAIMVAVSAGLVGTKGLTGALIGVAIVTIFFGLSIVVVGRAAKVSPQAMMITALTSYMIKILVLLFVVAKFSGTTAFNGRLFGLTAIVCVLAWTFSQVFWSMKLKVLYVEPDGER